MYMTLNYIWNLIRSELKKRVLVVDEAWYLMKYDESASFLYSMSKRSRKYYLGITAITQDVEDFLANKYGKPIITNSSLQLLLKQSTAAIGIIAKTFALTDVEQDILLQSDVGTGLFFAGNQHVPIEVVSSYSEEQVITSDPEAILARKNLETI
jgi:type IV secretory pathway VirB4 component